MNELPNVLRSQKKRRRGGRIFIGNIADEVRLDEWSFPRL